MIKKRRIKIHEFLIRKVANDVKNDVHFHLLLQMFCETSEGDGKIVFELHWNMFEVQIEVNDVSYAWECMK